MRLLAGNVCVDMKALKKSKGKFGIDGSPRGDNLFIWVRLTYSHYTLFNFNALITEYNIQGVTIKATNILFFGFKL